MEFLTSQQNKRNADAVAGKLRDYLSNLYLDTQGSPNAGGAEDYIIKLVSRLVISVCTSWYAIIEIFEYIKKRRLLRDLSTAYSCTNQ